MPQEARHAHCLSPLPQSHRIGEDQSLEEIACTSCGSNFHLKTESTGGWEQAAGQKLGKFELIDTVGHGEFGTVYKARDPELDRTVAIKVPRAGNLSGTKVFYFWSQQGLPAGQHHMPRRIVCHLLKNRLGRPRLPLRLPGGIVLIAKPARRWQHRAPLCSGRTFARDFSR